MAVSAQLLSHEVAFVADLWNRNQSIDRIVEVVADRFGKTITRSAVSKLAEDRPKIFKERGRGTLMRGGRNPYHAANEARSGAANDAYRPVTTKSDARAFDARSRRVPLLVATNTGGCLFPVNEAARGETHLFCGLPQLGGKVRYCAHHAERSVGSGTISERLAERDLRIEAKRAS